MSISTPRLNTTSRISSTVLKIFADFVDTTDQTLFNPVQGFKQGDPRKKLTHGPDNTLHINNMLCQSAWRAQQTAQHSARRSVSRRSKADLTARQASPVAFAKSRNLPPASICKAVTWPKKKKHHLQRLARLKQKLKKKKKLRCAHRFRVFARL